VVEIQLLRQGIHWEGPGLGRIVRARWLALRPGDEDGGEGVLDHTGGQSSRWPRRCPLHGGSGLATMRAVAAIRLFRPLLMSALALAFSLGCTNAYLQNEGPYELTAMEVLRDDCAMLSSSESLWDGTLRVSGEVIYMDYGLMDMQLVGFFLEGGSADDDAFALDGSLANASLSANGQQCIVDQVTVHLEGTTQCATQFNGVLRVRYEPRIQQPGCACELWVRYQAVQNSSPCASAP
jgi:hypothetical protein